MTNAKSIELRIGGMSCSNCPLAVEKSLLNVAGVVAARVNAATNIARIEYDAALAKIADILNAIRSLGYVPGMATTRIQVKDMHCSSCVVRIELGTAADTRGRCALAQASVTTQSVCYADDVVQLVEQVKPVRV